ncbi:TIGR03557 family F420-dependent LLM class oxidoreductase [Catellatospora methionotrophica]|uniref:TIGR03557 family F420-dependent LLM class oxidoreductase n=1 Tax=Catellatospora methionotrophica TaxID=121620 RepID=UPI00341012FB
MTNIGYTLMTEQRGPRELVDDAVRAEAAGFDFAVCSDHYYPWLDEQGHAPFAWSVLGAAAHATGRLPLVSFVTCPTMRYHPTVVAQMAATIGVMSQGRFTLGLGAGENLNEHVVGAYPHATQRHAMLSEALEIIQPLLAGEVVHHLGEYFEVPEARLWDLPDSPVPIGVAVSGPSSIRLATRHAAALIATEPKPELIRQYADAGGTGPRYGQVAICWGPDADECARIAHDQFRWFDLGWAVNAELPHPRSFAAATAVMTPAMVAEKISCGPDVDKHIAAVREFVDAGFTDVALVQIGGDSQPDFLDFAEKQLLPALAGG